MASVIQNTVKIRDLSYHFETSGRVIFDQVNLDIPQGKVTAIMGPSGSGKTTLLRLISGQLMPEQGKIWVEDQLISSLSRNALCTLRRKMGMLFQSGALFSDLSVFENVAFPLREHTRLSERFIRDIVLMKLEAVGLRGAHDLMPANLSGGMQRRAALARTIALDPTLILYDEPFAGQDPISMGVLMKLIRFLNEALGLTSIIVSHDVPETCSIADKIYVIAEGKIMGQGSPAELKSSTSPWINQFMQGLPDGPVKFHYPAPSYASDLLGGPE